MDLRSFISNEILHTLLTPLAFAIPSGEKDAETLTVTTSRVGTSRFGECGHIQINGRASFTSGDVAADVG